MPTRGVEYFYVALGRRIQQLRKGRGLTQEQLGARLTPQVTRASIANIESGSQRVLAHSLVQIATALDTPVEQLILEEQPPAPDRGFAEQVGEQLQQRLGLSPEDLRRLKRKIGLNEGGPQHAQTDSDVGSPEGGRDSG